MKFLEKHKKNLPWFFLCFLLGLAVGLPINGEILIRHIAAKSIPQEWRAGAQGLINPLLGVNFPDNTIFEDVQPLQKKLQDQVDALINTKQADRISIYFKDQNTSHWVGVNQTEAYAPASLIKIPMMISYFKIAEEHPEILNKQIVYTGPDHNTQEKFKPKEAMVVGRAYSVRDLIQRMIVYSDNNALLMLFNNMDKTKLDAIFSDLSITLPQDINKDGDYITPGNFSRFFRTLYNSTYLNEEYSEKALEYLSQAEFKEGLAGGVPAGTVVANKFGETPDIDATGHNIGYELHDCGIIYAPNHPYVLCVMTAGQSYEALTGVIQNISSTVWNAVSKDYK